MHLLGLGTVEEQPGAGDLVIVPNENAEELGIEILELQGEFPGSLPAHVGLNLEMLALYGVGGVFVAGPDGLFTFGRYPLALVGAEALVEVFLFLLFEPSLLGDEVFFAMVVFPGADPCLGFRVFLVAQDLTGL